MSARRHAAVLVIVAGALAAAAASAQRDVDAALLADIEAIKAIDNHAHVMRPVPDDRGFDALPLDALDPSPLPVGLDRKSTRLNSSHTVISYAVFCLKKEN